MTQYGVFSDEGCVEVLHSEEEAQHRADELVEDPEGYDPGDLAVHQICEYHDEQRADICEKCEEQVEEWDE